MGHENTGSGCSRPRVNPASTARRFRELFENIPDGVYESSPEGRILAANPALVQMLGFSSAEELRREGAAGLYVDPELRERNKRVLERDGRLINAELHLRRKDGSPLIVLENSRAVKDEEGNVLYYQGTLTDITERKQAEQELRAARDQALETSRLKSQFLANISHELRTPLNAVMGMSQILMSLPIEPAARECAETIHLSARILMDLITEILDFSRIEAGRLELESIPFDLRELIHQAATMLAARAADKGLVLLAWAESGVPGEVYGDPAKLQQVLVNLLSNAVKFTDRGEVELHVARKKCGEGQCVLRFTVRDTGIGIPAEAQAVIFEPFRQADGSTTRRYGGTGLGLAIVREILAQMGSRIELQSQPGAGSAFSFELEAPAGPNDARAPLEGDLLLLEPNPTARRVTEAWARGWGATVTHARDFGALALLLASARRRGAIRAIVANAAAVPPGDNSLWQALRKMPREARPAVVLVSAWEAGSEETEIPPGCGALRLKMPLNENELLRALERRDPAPAPPSLAALARSVSETAGGGTPRGRLLVAEDNAVNQTVVRRMLEKLGYSVDLVSNGKKALEALQHARYDLVLMDCQMPEMDGLLATAAIRESLPGGRRIPIIALTAHASTDDREACIAAGMDDYLSKPLMLTDLARTLEHWLGQKDCPPRGASEETDGVQQ